VTQLASLTSRVTPTERGDRVEQLDSVRGLAALSVVFCHHLLVFPFVWNVYASKYPGSNEAVLLFPPAYIFWAGHSAVVLFFVLSGYVLFLPVMQGRQPTYTHYVLKRFCRIYLPYAVAMAVTLFAASVLSRGEIPELSWWFRTSWNVQVEPRHIVEHALMLPEFDTERFNNPIWSLVHEMRVSLVFPFLALLVVRLRWPACLAVAACLSLAGCFGPQLHWRLQPLTGYGLTTHYAAMFVLGALLAKHRQGLGARLSTAPRLAWFGLVGVGAVLYASEGLHPAARIGPWVHQFEYLTAAGATILVASAASAAWLRAAPIVWLGRVSYSLYLWHLPVLLATVHVGYGHLPLWSLLTLSLALALIMAGLMHRLVEAPAARLPKLMGENASHGPKADLELHNQVKLASPVA